MRAKKGLASLPDSEEAETMEFLPPHLHWVWDAFAVLSRTRVVNQSGPQPIRIADLEAYSRLATLPFEWQRDDLLYHVTVLDIEWLKISYSKIEKAHEEAKKKAERDAKRKGRR